MSCNSKLINPRKGPLEPPIYSRLVRSIGDNLGLQLVSEFCVWARRQSCGTEPLTYGIWLYLWVDSVRTELNCRTPSWCHRELLVVGGKPQHIWWPEASKVKCSGLPWWRSGWESACQCRGHGFEPWSGKMPHATEQLGPWAAITDPARLEPVLCNKRGRDSERPAHRNEEWPTVAAAGESPRTETKTQHSHK